MVAPETHGLDIHGTYQPVSNWAAIPQFPLMSVKGTEGANTQQKNGKAYFTHFRERGFHYRGMYHWLRSDSTAQAQFENVKRWWDSMGGMQEGEFNQNDWEVTPGVPDPPVSLVLEFNDRCQQEWPDRLLVYVSDWVTGFHQWLATNPIEPIWYANFNTDAKNPNGGWQECAKYSAKLWQFTDNYSSPGIVTVCDGNHIFDFSALDKAAGYPSHQPPPPNGNAPTPTPTPKPLPNMEGEMKNTIARIIEDGTIIVGVANEQGEMLTGHWTTPGSPEVDDWLAALRGNGAVDVEWHRSYAKNVTLVGPLPPDYTTADFSPATQGS